MTLTVHFADGVAESRPFNLSFLLSKMGTKIAIWLVVEKIKSTEIKVIHTL